MDRYVISAPIRDASIVGGRPIYAQDGILTSYLLPCMSTNYATWNVHGIWSSVTECFEHMNFNLTDFPPSLGSSQKNSSNLYHVNVLAMILFSLVKGTIIKKKLSIMAGKVLIVKNRISFRM